MQDGFYFLCPQCEQFGKTFLETWLSKSRYEAEITKEGQINYNEYDNDAKPEYCLCKECEFKKEECSAEVFEVRIKDNKIIEWGAYWDKHINKLKEIANKHGLKATRCL